MEDRSTPEVIDEYIERRLAVGHSIGPEEINILLLRDLRLVMMAAHRRVELAKWAVLIAAWLGVIAAIATYLSVLKPPGCA